MFFYWYLCHIPSLSNGLAAQFLISHTSLSINLIEMQFQQLDIHRACTLIFISLFKYKPTSANTICILLMAYNYKSNTPGSLKLIPHSHIVLLLPPSRLSTRPQIHLLVTYVHLINVLYIFIIIYFTHTTKKNRTQLLHIWNGLPLKGGYDPRTTLGSKRALTAHTAHSTSGEQ